MPAKSRHYIELKTAFSREWAKLWSVEQGLNVYPQAWLHSVLNLRPCLQLHPTPELVGPLLRVGNMRVLPFGRVLFAYGCRSTRGVGRWRAATIEELAANTAAESLTEIVEDVILFRESLAYWLANIAPRAYANGKLLESNAQLAQKLTKAHEARREQILTLGGSGETYLNAETETLFLTRAELTRINESDSTCLVDLRQYELMATARGTEYANVPAKLAAKAKALRVKPRKPYTRKLKQEMEL